MDRERGTETMPCPTCGNQLAVVELGDGSRTTVLCKTCYGPAPEKAAVAEKREFGTEIEEKDDDD